MAKTAKRRVMSLFLPRWPIDRRFGRSARPDRAFVLATSAGGRRIVTAANATAAAEGIFCGMGLADARALAPALLAEEADFLADAAGLTKLAQWCERFSPWVASCGADGLFLDVTGCVPLFGDEAALAAQAVERLARQGVEARVAIADTLGAAWALSRFGGSRFGTVAAAAAVPPGSARQVLADLPVAALRLDPDSAALLARLGLQRIGELYATPRAALAARCGAGVLQRLDQALGLAAEPLSPLQPPPLLWARRSFAEPIVTPEAIAAALHELLQHLCRRLGEEGMGARQLVLALYRIDGRIERTAIGTAFPSRDTRHLGRLLEEKLPQIDPGLGIEDMMLTAMRAEKRAATQLGFAEDRGGESADLAALIDRLANRLGPRALARPVLRESHIPERAVRFVPPLESAAPMATWDPAKLRPIRLLPRPEPIEATAPIPDDPPLLFRWRQRAYRVRCADGPERIAAEWWRIGQASEPELRDYYRVEDEEGGRFWLYRAGLYRPETPPRWFLHGFFG